MWIIYLQKGWGAEPKYNSPSRWKMKFLFSLMVCKQPRFQKRVFVQKCHLDSGSQNQQTKEYLANHKICIGANCIITLLCSMPFPPPERLLREEGRDCHWPLASLPWPWHAFLTLGEIYAAVCHSRLVGQPTYTHSHWRVRYESWYKQPNRQNPSGDEVIPQAWSRYGLSQLCFPWSPGSCSPEVAASGRHPSDLVSEWIFSLGLMSCLGKFLP